MRARRSGSYLSVLLMGLLAACGQQDPQREQAEQAGESGAGPALQVATVSTVPWLVTGGDVLLRVSGEDLDAQDLRISLNGVEVSSAFAPHEDGLLGLVQGLDEGVNELTVAAGGGERSVTAELTSYPVYGPVISGPHETPFICQTEDFELPNGERLGAPLDEHCSVETRVDYYYFSAEEQEFRSWPEEGRPDDLADVTTLEGQTVPFIVRTETGTVNRAIYEIAILHDPDDPAPDPWRPSQGWNEKLVYTHGGGCRGGWYQQGERTGGVMREGLLSMGYALASSSLNVFGQNCNDLLASETHMMVKERFIEHYGEPVYTIATGASGGSYQSHQTADNYPGIFDGLIVSASFPDVTSATIFTLADSRLLHYFFTEVEPELFSRDQQLAVSGFAEWESLPNLSRGAARIDPVYFHETEPEEQGGEVSVQALETRRYHPAIPEGVRATVYDHTRNVYGTDPESGFALRPLDNYGVQYGLAALNAGDITAEQFLRLNEGIGGFDRDANHIPERHRADAFAARRALDTGRILDGGNGLATTPVIDYRSYTDDREGGDIHMIIHQYSTRARLEQANGHFDNHVMAIGGRWGFSEEAPDLRQLFEQMDQWLMNIRAGEGAADAASVAAARPASLADHCWDYSGGDSLEARVRVQEELRHDSEGRCAELYPVWSTPRHVAGAPIENHIVSCRLREIDPEDYMVDFSEDEMQRLRRIFPDGVCDWGAGDAHSEGYQGDWLSFGPSPVNRVD